MREEIEMKNKKREDKPGIENVLKATCHRPGVFFFSFLFIVRTQGADPRKDTGRMSKGTSTVCQSMTTKST